MKAALILPTIVSVLLTSPFFGFWVGINVLNVAGIAPRGQWIHFTGAFVLACILGGTWTGLKITKLLRYWGCPK